MIENDMGMHTITMPTQQVAALSTMAIALPGLGIVAAVLGVVITMGSLGGPPEEIGQKVAAALVGTFLGIRCATDSWDDCGEYAEGRRKRSTPTIVAVLIVSLRVRRRDSRWSSARAIPGNVRPSFQDTEKYIKDKVAKRHRRSVSETMPGPPPIIIKKKSEPQRPPRRRVKGAYADFVTAMMALFIVLWLRTVASKSRKGGGYFKDPTGTSKMVGTICWRWRTISW